MLFRSVGAAAIVFGVMQFGAWMKTDGGIPLLRVRHMKLTAPGYGDHGEDPQPT